MPVKKDPQTELTKMRSAIAAAEAESSTECRIKAAIAAEAAKIPGSSRNQCRKLIAALGGLFLELEIEMLEPVGCPCCGRQIEEKGGA
ncbi:MULTISPECIES: hypothetical protein [Methylomonas]|uniref:Uncharacterized protein n=2 Tax=Methylomonas TaxID=416 RepID=A0A126T8T8_9GAMM|nr:MULTISPECIES: hypothetical protein [Methylomonas]AMK78509.1 hypothetical protein JT25_018780 [Methylomonas denitrificans]OAI09119.1 hypothetical protein A1342_13435 [Methylomonas methanica]TCV82276.1 hypothetical protein EDE11_11439 [Methylomonas methanica]